MTTSSPLHQSKPTKFLHKTAETRKNKNGGLMMLLLLFLLSSDIISTFQSRCFFSFLTSPPPIEFESFSKTTKFSQTRLKNKE